MTDVTLKPCVLCGCKLEIESLGSTESMLAYKHPENGCVLGNVGFWCDEPEKVKSWNTRTPDLEEAVRLLNRIKNLKWHHRAGGGSEYSFFTTYTEIQEQTDAFLTRMEGK